MSVVPQAQESASLSEEMRTQLEQVQQRLNLVREEVIENSISREKESFNARRAQVPTKKHARTFFAVRLTFLLVMLCLQVMMGSCNSFIVYCDGSLLLMPVVNLTPFTFSC